MFYCLEANLMKKECLRKIVLMVDIIHLAIQLNVVVLIVVKIQSTFAENVILDFTLIALKVIRKM